MIAKAYIFDLDGTLLDTLPDLVRLTNMVLEARGWPTRSRDEVLSYVGDGGYMLLRRAAPEGTPADQLDEAFSYWRELYPTYGHERTRPYPDVPEMLERLKQGGTALGVLSNKFDAAVKEVIAAQFPGLFDVARGECADIPRKPDPRGLLRLLDELSVNAGSAVYVGDSVTDVEVAQRAGVKGVAVSWGYQDVAKLRAAGAQLIIDHPLDLLEA